MRSSIRVMTNDEFTHSPNLIKVGNILLLFRDYVIITNDDHVIA